MASVQQGAASRRDRQDDRKAWSDAVEQILGRIPDRAVGDDAERMATALRSISSLMRRLSESEDTPQTKAA